MSQKYVKIKTTHYILSIFGQKIENNKRHWRSSTDIKIIESEQSFLLLGRLLAVWSRKELLCKRNGCPGSPSFWRLLMNVNDVWFFLFSDRRLIRCNEMFWFLHAFGRLNDLGAVMVFLAAPLIEYDVAIKKP